MYLKTVYKIAFNIHGSFRVIFNTHYRESLQYLISTSFSAWFFQSFPNSEEHAFLASPGFNSIKSDSARKHPPWKQNHYSLLIRIRMEFVSKCKVIYTINHRNSRFVALKTVFFCPAALSPAMILQLSTWTLQDLTLQKWDREELNIQKKKKTEYQHFPWNTGESRKKRRILS